MDACRARPVYAEIGTRKGSGPGPITRPQLAVTGRRTAGRQFRTGSEVATLAFGAETTLGLARRCCSSRSLSRPKKTRGIRPALPVVETRGIRRGGSVERLHRLSREAACCRIAGTADGLGTLLRLTATSAVSYGHAMISIRCRFPSRRLRLPNTRHRPAGTGSFATTRSTCISLSRTDVYARLQ